MSTYAYESLLLFQAYAGRRKTLDASDLIPIPSLSSQPVEASSVVVLDSGIYVIGGLIDGEKRTSDVWSLDCWTHVWHTLSLPWERLELTGLLVW